MWSSCSVYYNETKLEIGFRLDLLIEDKVIIEVKSVENLAEVHPTQVLTYLKLTKLKLGILVNFNTDIIKSGIFRKVNDLWKIADYYLKVKNISRRSHRGMQIFFNFE